jgi:hypothetical protein
MGYIHIIFTTNGFLTCEVIGNVMDVPAKDWGNAEIEEKVSAVSDFWVLTPRIQ